MDGIGDSNEENTKDTVIVTLELDDTGGIVGPDLLPNTLPPSKVLHPKPWPKPWAKAGIGHLQQEYSRTSDGDTFVNYEFPEDPKAFIVPHGPNRGKREPSIYNVFLV